ncbi:hypothetical protein HHK36_016975 [Tetracentron sinense]|uniref:Uncharacterized protein n=1 Tax=Tetracentron sinense TaxID=13715 RepID=A0A834YY48_TETSI|nr:hypothetical protein HHK36_016975 [Tetracentron sinense]
MWKMIPFAIVWSIKKEKSKRIFEGKVESNNMVIGHASLLHYLWSSFHKYFKENSSHFLFAGEFLSILPVDPKLGKMLIMGAIFRCFDPVLTIVAGLSVRDPFLLPQDKKDVSS